MGRDQPQPQAALVLGGCGIVAYRFAGSKLDTAGKIDFDSPLGISPLT